MVGGAVALGELAGGAVEVAGLVQRQAFPLRVCEVPGGIGRTLPFKQALALLVGAQPQVVELERVAGLRHGQQQRQAEQPAAAAGASGQ
ncbi:hypothetical protein D3C79_799960 [compost metagenome]